MGNDKQNLGFHIHQRSSRQKVASFLRLGVSADNIRTWRRQLGKNGELKDSRNPAQAMADFEEIKRLKKHLRYPNLTNKAVRSKSAKTKLNMHNRADNLKNY